MHPEWLEKRKTPLFQSNLTQKYILIKFIRAKLTILIEYSNKTLISNCVKYPWKIGVPHKSTDN